MDGSYFDHIAEEILKQKRHMEQVADENRALRQQLAALRAGEGVFLEIAGSRLALQGNALPQDHPLGSR